MDKISKVVDDYYNFIIKYEKILNKYKVFNKDGNLAKIYGSKFEDLYNLYYIDYLPWRKIKGDVKDYLFRIFSNGEQAMLSYIKAEDGVDDLLYELAEADLINYYSKKGLDVLDDLVLEKIKEEASEIDFKKEIDEKKFSESVVKLRSLSKGISNISDRLIKIYQNKNLNKEIVL